MENSGVEERRRRGEENVLGCPCPCSIFQEAIEAVLKCLGLDSSPRDGRGTETEVDSGIGSMISSLVRGRRPRPPVSSGRGGQVN